MLLGLLNTNAACNIYYVLSESKIFVACTCLHYFFLTLFLQHPCFIINLLDEVLVIHNSKVFCFYFLKKISFLRCENMWFLLKVRSKIFLMHHSLLNGLCFWKALCAQDLNFFKGWKLGWKKNVEMLLCLAMWIWMSTVTLQKSYQFSYLF